MVGNQFIVFIISNGGRKVKIKIAKKELDKVLKETDIDHLGCSNSVFGVFEALIEFFCKS